MGRCIVKIKDQYLIWSSVVDAPITYGMTLNELKSFIKEEQGNNGLFELEPRLVRVEQKGTSALIHNSLQETISYNRAGPKETKLTEEEIYQRYCVDRVG